MKFPHSLCAHPAVHNVNDLQAERTSATEKFCQRIAAGTGAPITLVGVIVFQIVWIVVGQLTKMDPLAQSDAPQPSPTS